jgi:oligopeptide/dipeptide ABC transporter ATP-binding protein
MILGAITQRCEPAADGSAIDGSSRPANACSAGMDAQSIRTTGPAPSPRWGEGWGEGGGPVERSSPPHPDPLPNGEREVAEFASPPCVHSSGTCSSAPSRQDRASSCQDSAPSRQERATALLQVDDLQTHFFSRDRFNRPLVARALNGVSFSVARGEILGLVGETGAGKSLTAYSILGILRPSARVVAGEITFDGMRLDTMPAGTMNTLRGRRLALIVQNPKTSLDPLTRIGRQLMRIYRPPAAAPPARQRALQMLEMVGIPDPVRRMDTYPHELSGGMAQRVVIAAALMNEPDLLFADEPTTGLDVTVQAQVLDLLAARVREARMGCVLITHDLGVVAQYCNRVAVMYAGRIVEIGAVAEVFRHPSHPYTRALLDATPERLRRGGSAIHNLPPPNLYALPAGCPYRDRCGRATEDCSTPPPQVAVAPAHTVSCHHAEPAS